MAATKTVRIHIDAERCQGHNRCKAILPDLIDLDGYGNAYVKGDGRVPEALVEKAYLATSNCPEIAVTIDES